MMMNLQKKKKPMMMMLMMPFLLMELPLELLLHVLTRLRLKYLMRLRCVSKFFLDLTNNPSFITSYYRSSKSNPPPNNLSSLDHDYYFNFMETSPPSSLNLIPCKSNQWPWRFHLWFKGSNFIYIQKRHELIPFHCPSTKRLIGSANGLVCFGGTDSLEIYNIFAGTNYYLIHPNFPSTAPEPLWIPPAPPYKPPNPIFVFGYDPISNDYKILSIEKEHYRRAVYSFATNSWKSMPLDWNNSPTYRNNSEGEGRSVCINGVIYWPPGRHRYYFDDKIVLFDVHIEQFKLIELPKEDLLLPTQYADIQLLSFRGCLAFAFIKRRTSSGGGVVGEILVELFTLNDLNLSDSVYLQTGAAYAYGLGAILVKFFISSESKHLWNKHSFVVPIPSPTKEEEVEILSCCDEIFLGWFESNQLRLYNLHTKCIFNLPLSPPSHYYPKASFMEKKKDNPTYVDNLSFDFSLI